MLNFIKSSYILKIVTDNLDMKIKIKIFKVNKSLLEKLEIDKKVITKLYSEKILNKCDSKHFYDYLIDDYVLEFLDLSKVEINDDDNILNLSNNKIGNLKAFTKGGFLDDYDFLYLSNNLISNIEELEKNDFNGLIRLILSMNKIKDISVLERAKLSKLRALNLSNNIIFDINVLEKVNLNVLEELYFHGNEISDITVLKRVKFPKLKILDLSKNKIIDVTVFKNLTNFQNLNHLNLSKNTITDISVFTNWIINYNKVRNEDLKESENLSKDFGDLYDDFGNLSKDVEDVSDDSEDFDIYKPDNKIKSNKIFGNLEILDLSNNNIIFHDNSKKIKSFENIYDFINKRTILILGDNNIYKL